MAREHIRALRKLSNLSQAALGKKSGGLTAAEISRIECGYRDLSVAEAGAIAKALGVEVEKVVGTSRLTEPPVPAASVVSAPATAAPEPMKPVVTGQDLNDPGNFRELPVLDELRQGTLAPEVFRARLRSAVDRATKILHTSRVPADVWRAWRDFERRAQVSLREISAVPALPLGVRPNSIRDSEAVQHPAPSDSSPTRADTPFRIGKSSRERHEQKSYNSLFVQAARKILPTEFVSQLNQLAEHRLKADRSVGFTRHFRNVAGEMLPAAEAARIAAEVRSNETVRGRRGCDKATPPSPASTSEVAPPK